VTLGELSAKYPRLYHMAARDSWKSIRKYGLLSTSRLLDLFEIAPPLTAAIELTRRPNSVPLEHKVHGRVVVRDQKPLSESKLKDCLKDCDTVTWFRMLNGRVFFWLDLERLKTMMSAREYRGKTHTVLTVDTEALVRYYENKITLCPLNSGNTSPYAHPRGLDSFHKLSTYPFKERFRKGDYYCVVELAVKDGVPDIAKYALRVAHCSCRGGQLRTSRILYKAPQDARRMSCGATR